ncbi:MAG: hypothetical protein ABWZ76_11460 [Acidimicrobiales bacterium]
MDTDRNDDVEIEHAGDARRIDDPNSENRDDHPVGTTTGTGAGATAGAVAGAVVAGPAGAVVGGVIGGVAGGLAGHGVAEKVNPDGDEVSGDKIPDPGTMDHRAPGPAPAARGAADAPRVRRTAGSHRPTLRGGPVRVRVAVGGRGSASGVVRRPAR